MSRSQKGFTLIELMMSSRSSPSSQPSPPNLLAARLSANETAAVATLRNIISAQAQFKGAKADTDNDGTGEYGGFVELSAPPGRMVASGPPVLSARSLSELAWAR